MMMEPYRIAIADELVEDLHDRLRRTRWPDEIDNADWQRGTSREFLEELVRYWRDDFDWRAVEAKLNELPHFRTEIDGLAIHFVHLRGEGTAPLPLIATHGWPSTFVELTKLLPLLTRPVEGDAFAFDVVIPSLPGFAFSESPREPLVHRRVPEMWVELMTRLGYERFGAHGGDLGGGVTARLAMYHPDRIVGIHVTNVYGSIDDETRAATDAERDYLADIEMWRTREGAYAAVQGTKPQTLAFGLHDSPVGLAAWIVEKLRSWSDSGGNIERVFSYDEILTTISIYWLTGTIGASFRPYYDSANDPAARPWQRIEVPCAVAVFPADIARPPREFAERSYDVRRWTEMPRGGHFAAAEQPELLAADIRAFFRSLR